MDQFYFSLVKGKCTLFAKAAIGASGAATLSAANSLGITSITRGTAGKYTIVLADVWYKFLWIDGKVLLASGTPAALGMAIVSEAVATPGTRTIVVQFLDAAGAAADIDSGATVYFKIDLSNVSVQ